MNSFLMINYDLRVIVAYKFLRLSYPKEFSESTYLMECSQNQLIENNAISLFLQVNFHDHVNDRLDRKEKIYIFREEFTLWCWGKNNLERFTQGTETTKAQRALKELNRNAYAQACPLLHGRHYVHLTH